jgi:hypothetical protein
MLALANEIRMQMEKWGIFGCVLKAKCYRVDKGDNMDVDSPYSGDSASPGSFGQAGAPAASSRRPPSPARCGEFRVLGSFPTLSTDQLLVSSPWWCPKSA